MSRLSKQILPNFGQRVETLRADNGLVKSKVDICQTFFKLLANTGIQGQSEIVNYRFSAAVVPWGGEGSFYFCNLPIEMANEISEVTAGLRRGFGSVRVDVTCGTSHWRTSIFLDSKAKSYLLPVKKAIRTAEGIGVGAIATFEIELVDF